MKCDKCGNTIDSEDLVCHFCNAEKESPMEEIEVLNEVEENPSIVFSENISIEDLSVAKPKKKKKKKKKKKTDNSQENTEEIDSSKAVEEDNSKKKEESSKEEKSSEKKEEEKTKEKKTSKEKEEKNKEDKKSEEKHEVLEEKKSDKKEKTKKEENDEENKEETSEEKHEVLEEKKSDKKEKAKKEEKDEDNKEETSEEKHEVLDEKESDNKIEEVVEEKHEEIEESSEDISEEKEEDSQETEEKEISEDKEKKDEPQKEETQEEVKEDKESEEKTEGLIAKELDIENQTTIYDIPKIISSEEYVLDQTQEPEDVYEPFVNSDEIVPLPPKKTILFRIKDFYNSLFVGYEKAQEIKVDDREARLTLDKIYDNNYKKAKEKRIHMNDVIMIWLVCFVLSFLSFFVFTCISFIIDIAFGSHNNIPLLMYIIPFFQIGIPVFLMTFGWLLGVIYSIVKNKKNR